jgi:hypothetical protein
MSVNKRVDNLLNTDIEAFEDLYTEIHISSIGIL